MNVVYVVAGNPISGPIYYLTIEVIILYNNALHCYIAVLFTVTAVKRKVKKKVK